MIPLVEPAPCRARCDDVIDILSAAYACPVKNPNHRVDIPNSLVGLRDGLLIILCALANANQLRQFGNDDIRLKLRDGY